MPSPHQIPRRLLSLAGHPHPGQLLDPQQPGQPPGIPPVGLDPIPRRPFPASTLGSRVVGGLLVKRADIFVNLFMRGGIKREKLSQAEREMYKNPHPTPASREPIHVMPREILTADELLADVERGLERVADRPALLVWADKDPAFKQAQRSRWENTFPNHQTHILRGASHYIQEDAPEEIIAAITDWWPTTKPRG